MEMQVLSQWSGVGLKFCISNKLPHDVSVAGLLTTLGAVSVGCTLKPNGETASRVRLGHQEISPHSQDHWFICPLLNHMMGAVFLQQWYTSHLNRTLLNLALTCHSLLSMALWLLHFPVGLRMPRGTPNALKRACSMEFLLNHLVVSFQGLPAEGEV